MELQTIVKLSSKDPFRFDYGSKLLLFGSCFAEHIGAKLDYYNFRNFCNPFGILFHPLAIEQAITAAINQKEYQKEELFFLNEQWHSFDAHSQFSETEGEELLSNLNMAVSNTNNDLNEASHLIISLGTAWVYRHIDSDRIVANCHKMPQKKFLKQLLSVEEVAESLDATIRLVRSVNSKISIIFTVSPVRHIKDGIIENNRSKAHLISAVHQVLSPRDNTHYFPSYEILMDELRDYRYYQRDMLHPAALAVDHIWEKFRDVWIHPDAETTMQEVASIRKAKAHRPFNPTAQEHQNFLEQLQKKMETLKKEFPFMSFE